MLAENVKNEITAIESVKNEAAGIVPLSDTSTVFKLSKPFKWEDKTYTEFRFDFEKLIGADMISIESEMSASGQYVISPEISTPYLSKLAAKAAGTGSDVIEHLPIRDFSKIRSIARNFLIKTGLAE